jgi:hypothetical protein
MTLIIRNADRARRKNETAKRRLRTREMDNTCGEPDFRLFLYASVDFWLNTDYTESVIYKITERII